MTIIKKILLKILSVNTYLSLVSRIYILMIKLGIGKKKYPEIFFLKNIIKDSWICIDIGANVGYYSYFLSKYTGRNGFVYAVEPVPTFTKIWTKNMKKAKYKNYKLLKHALGEEEKTVKMGTPIINGVLHHGMTKLIKSSEDSYTYSYNVEMKNPNMIFKDLERINFIKIDIEGYEYNVLSSMKDLINKHKPIIQAELSGEENRKNVISMLNQLSYNLHILQNGELISYKLKSENEKNDISDYYFIPQNGK